LVLGFLVAVVSLSLPVPARTEGETVFTVDGAHARMTNSSVLQF